VVERYPARSVQRGDVDRRIELTGNLALDLYERGHATVRSSTASITLFGRPPPLSLRTRKNARGST